jgi:hypothetical protein
VISSGWYWSVSQSACLRPVPLILLRMFKH